MKKLTEFDDNEVFYKGTIIILKGTEITPKGVFDARYAMIGGFGGSSMECLNLHKSIGSITIHNFKPNVEGHHGLNKQGIRDWVKEYFELFYTEAGKKEWIPKIDDIVFIEDLDDYFTQTNRDLFMI